MLGFAIIGFATAHGGISLADISFWLILLGVFIVNFNSINNNQPY
jgi:hypothetical protein